MRFSPGACLWMLLLAILTLNVYRARTQSFTVDEAFTYLNFVDGPDERQWERPDTNNHVLNTSLSKMAVRCWGTSELALRLPSLAGGALYLLASLWLVTRLFGAGWMSVVVFIAMTLNPILLDYMVAARGYSLGLGLFFAATALMVRQLHRPASTGGVLLWDGATGALLGLSVAANLTFLLPVVLLSLFYLSSHLRVEAQFNRDLGALKAAVLLFTAAFVFQRVAGRYVEHLTGGSFYFGALSFRQMLDVLFYRSLAVPRGRALSAILAWLILPFVVISSGRVWWWAFRGRRDDLAQRTAFALFPLTLATLLLTWLILHNAAGVPYPYERTGIYLLPLITLTLAGATRVAGLWGKWTMALLCLICLQYVLELRTGWFEEWKFDAGTRRVMEALRREHDGKASPVTLGVSWQLQASTEYYRQSWRLQWIRPVTREMGGSDYYYLMGDDAEQVRRRGLRVLYRDPVSNAVLASPSSENFQQCRTATPNRDRHGADRTPKSGLPLRSRFDVPLTAWC
jgi:hypothetical protein